MATPANAQRHGTLLRTMLYACADSIQGPAAPETPAELARRILRHIAMTIGELITGSEPDTVAGHAQLAAELADTLARTAPADAGLDEASAATIRAMLLTVEKQGARFAEWHGVADEHVAALLEQVDAARALLDAVVRWGGDADAARAASRYAAQAAASLRAAVPVLENAASATSAS